MTQTPTLEATSVESRLRAVEDRIAIQQLVCGYSYAVDGLNADAVGSFYAEDGVYAVADMAPFVGRQRVADITRDANHRALIAGGVAHVSLPPYVVLDGDSAIATCHTMVIRNGETGFYVWRLSASRLQLQRKPEGGWEIKRRDNQLLDGNPAAPALLARLLEGVGA
jgi:ketosteroid isomerase-like protein